MAQLNFDKDGSGGGGAKPLLSAYLRHQIYLQRYSTGEARKLLDIMDTANSQIKQVVFKAKGIETKEKYRRVSQEIKRIKTELYEQLHGQIELDFLDLAAEEALFVNNALNKQFNIKLDLELPAPKKVWAAASFGPYSEDGHENFESYLNGLTKNLYNVWDSQIKAGYLAGLTAQQINRNVLGSVKAPLEPGQMQFLRNSLERNTRTMTACMAEEARDAVYRENGSIFDGYRYVATLDTRTCLMCGNDDGKVFKSLDPDVAPKLPRHQNDRCLYLPVIKGRGGVEAGERAAMDGPVSGKTTWKDWLAGQDEALQLDVLGPSRYAMYKAGADTGEFATDKRVFTLDELKNMDDK
jgi:hypothetical protein